MENSITKRDLLKKGGATLAGLSIVGTAQGQSSDDTESSGQASSGPEVEPQVAENVSVSFSDYTISVNDDSTLSSTWQVSTPLGAVQHSMEVMVEAANAEKPQLRASDFTASDIVKNFEYTSSSQLPVNYDAYHFRAVKQSLQVPGTTVEVELDATVTGDSSGDVHVQSGFPSDQYQPIGSGIWSGALLTVQ